MIKRWTPWVAAVVVVLAGVATPVLGQGAPRALAAAPRATVQTRLEHNFGRKAFRLAIHVLAKQVHMKVADVTAAMRHGKTLAQVAAAHKISRAALQKAILAQVNARLKEAVAKKRISAGSSGTIYKSIAGKINQLLDYKMKAKAVAKGATKGKHKAQKGKKPAPAKGKSKSGGK